MSTVFDQYRTKAYPYQFNVTIVVDRILGGVPSDANVAESWLRTKIADKDDIIRKMVAETMLERGVTAEEATAIVDANRHLNGFKRDDKGLYIEGRQLKAAVKEAANAAAGSGKLKMKGWGTTNKWILAFVAEHIFIPENHVHLGVKEPTGIVQRFVHTHRGNGIQYEEYVDDAELHFTVISDNDFSKEEWSMIWLTGEQQGIGASRSQGYGRYKITQWDPIVRPAAKKKAAAAK